MSIEWTVTKSFEAAPEEVFRALTDLDAAEAWMPNLVAIERLDEGALGTGSEWRETRKMFGKEATEHFEVTGLDEPRSLELRVDGSRGSSKKGEYLFRYELTPTPGGTEVRLDGSVEGLSGMAAILGRFFVGAMRKACARDLAALREYVDAQ